jgi:cytochrome c oxidase assembly protein subunit 11
MRAQKPSRNRLLAVALLGVVFGMVGMAYAAVPLYALFCRVTGYGGTTQVAQGPSGRVLDREIVVRFDANVRGLPWAFRPAVPELRLRVGETGTVSYVAENASERATIGTATFNVAPPSAGAYFNKIACFCFTEQALAPGERIEMSVQFFVDPGIAEDRDLDAVDTITLSYTFFPVAQPGQGVARAGGDVDGKSM